ncbi:pq loop repeat protein [Grosmannia clavigera kw1407]|uniref:Pq loop repeat protein n=1 Tax=Grosmannia clavigera (strain kw1407 / UAMH 11150) TaxID=655863 RepID=F0XAF9_GROCL|nr:pq loop repeat protein [Grosmannia clavigera kw1407]EFX05566.1 pq loop repeat protein [Grosmannia clavigera kw1407]
MVPPTGPLNLGVEEISGICGSISIACWVVVFSPQIIENFRRGSADGLSLQFIIVWLAGDVFNILGAVLQGVLPTMIILAIYYTIADIVLLGQCFYYRGFTWRDDVVPPKAKTRKTKTKRAVGTTAAGTVNESILSERSALLSQDESHRNHHHSQGHDHHERRRSSWSALSPAVPFVSELGSSEHHTSASVPSASASPASARSSASRLQATALNFLAILMVCAAGVAGWYLSGGAQEKKSQPPPSGEDGSGDDPLVFSVWGQIFGYFCAVLYLGSRLPQLLLNWRRQSTEGVSMLFFLFACLGNLTYVLSIFAHEEHRNYPPGEARRRYGRYLLVNLSWLAGSLGTLLLDMGIFIQFFMYQRIEDDGSEDDGDDATEVATSYSDDEDDDETFEPILQRNTSYYG